MHTGAFSDQTIEAGSRLGSMKDGRPPKGYPGGELLQCACSGGALLGDILGVSTDPWNVIFCRSCPFIV